VPFLWLARFINRNVFLDLRNLMLISLRVTIALVSKLCLLRVIFGFIDLVQTVERSQLMILVSRLVFDRFVILILFLLLEKHVLINCRQLCRLTLLIDFFKITVGRR